ncbi:hypothetical protein Tco_1568507 [Tanacetum coccineum]
MTPLPPRDQRHLWLRYQVEGYTKEIVHNFEQRLETIFGRQVNRVHILDFEGLTPDMRQDLVERLRIVYTGDDGHEMGLDAAGTLCFQLGGSRHSMTWIQFILALGLHTTEEIAEDKFRAYWKFLRGAPSYTYIIDLVQILCHRHVEGRKSDAKLLGGHFIRRLAHHFGLVNDDGLRGLSVVAYELPLIDMGPKRQPDAVAGAAGAAKDAPAVNKRLGRLEEEMQGLRQDVKSLRGLVERTKPGSKFSTIVREYVTKPSTLSKSRAELRGESVNKSVEAERKV